jgi:hypothetical protein
MQDFRQNTPEGFTRQQVRLKGALQFWSMIFPLGPWGGKRSGGWGA